MTDEIKNRESRLRRKARGQGLLITKSRRRDPNAPDYGAYWILKPENDSGHWRSRLLVSWEGGIGLDEVEEYLSQVD